MLAVFVQEPVQIGYQQYRVAAVAASILATHWFRLSCGDGTKAEQLYGWASVAFNCSYAPQWQGWLFKAEPDRKVCDSSTCNVLQTSATPL